jgi:peptide/nickel transport system ATP-binding protein
MAPGGRGADVVLRAEHLSVSYAARRPVRAVRDVSLELRRGEVLGIVGESGCGKSTLAYALSRLLRPPAELTGGKVLFCGRDGVEMDLAALTTEQLRQVRSTRVAMVFQSAMNALNPVTSIGHQFRDIFGAHGTGMDRGAMDARAGDLLEMVGIDRGRLRSFAHELSGGMRQRVVIAMALSLDPEVVIMDEPTTALDVVVQQEILDEIERLREALGFSIIFITHDLSLLLEVSDTLAVMYAGKIVEYAPTELVAAGPAHPYTLGLLRSFPDMRGERRELRGVPGSPPDLRERIAGCAFAPRCGYALQVCQTAAPALLSLPEERSGGMLAADWRVACHLHNPDVHRTGPPAELSGTVAVPPGRTVAAPDDLVAGRTSAGESAGGLR